MAEVAIGIGGGYLHVAMLHFATVAKLTQHVAIGGPQAHQMLRMQVNEGSTANTPQLRAMHAVVARLSAKMELKQVVRRNLSACSLPRLWSAIWKRIGLQRQGRFRRMSKSTLRSYISEIRDVSVYLYHIDCQIHQHRSCTVGFK